MGTMVSQITSLTIVYSTVYSGADQRKHQSSASLAFVRGIHRSPVNSPHKLPVTRKIFPFDDVIMRSLYLLDVRPCANMVVSLWNLTHHFADALVEFHGKMITQGLSRLCQKWHDFSPWNRFFEGSFFEAGNELHQRSMFSFCIHFTTEAINTLRPRQNGRHFADDIFKRISLNENILIPIKISLTFVPKGSINNIPALVQIMAWRRPGDKPLSEPMMVKLPTHICVTRPQWVKCHYNHVQLFVLPLHFLTPPLKS